MLEDVYDCQADSLIHCFAVTQSYIFFAESPLSNRYQISLYYYNYKKKQSVIRSDYPIKVSSTRLKDDDANYQVKSMQFVSVPIINDDAPLVTKFFLVLNTGDGIQICQLEEIISKRMTTKVDKWHHDKPQDTIDCIYSQGNKDGTILITYCCVSGSIVNISFNITTKSFSQKEPSRQIIKCQDRIMDRINNICGLRNFPPNYPDATDEKLWTTVSSKNAMLFSCFDNNFYAIIDSKLEIQGYHDFPHITNENVTLIWTDFVIVKQYSSKSLLFCVANVSNVGCAIYKRSLSGIWDMVRVLPREFDIPEETSLINCVIQFDSSTPNQFSIFCGSEDGKIYQWVYDYRDDSLLESNIFKSENTGVVHSLCLVGTNKILFLCHNNTSIRSISFN